MRGYKWKMLEAALGMKEITSREFSQATGLAAHLTHPYAQALINDGYLKLVREEPPERGGRPRKVYAWTGKKPSSHGGAVISALDDMWGRADATVITCFNRMVRCREDADARACAV